MPDLPDPDHRSAAATRAEGLVVALKRAGSNQKERAFAYAEFFQTRLNPAGAPPALATAVLVLDANERIDTRAASSAFERRTASPSLPAPFVWSTFRTTPVAPSSVGGLSEGLPPIVFAMGGEVSERDLSRAIAFLDAPHPGGWRPAAREALTVLADLAAAAGPYAAEFSTSPENVRLLVALARPRPGEHVVDPACGFGSALAACLDAAPGVRVSGGDLNVATALVSAARVALAGGDPSTICQADALTSTSPADADIVVLDPPFGLRLRTPHAGPLGETTQGDVAFLQTALARLRPGGRALIVVSAGLLGAAKLEPNRRALLAGFAVDAVVALPRSATIAVERAVLCLSRAEPHADVWFAASSVTATALKDRRALDALACGVAARRGVVPIDAVREQALTAPSGMDLVQWFDPATNEPAVLSDAELSELAGKSAWSQASCIVADALLDGGWYDELHENAAAGVSWREPVAWLLDHGASLAVRQTGVRELQSLLDRLSEIVPERVAIRPLADLADVFRGTRVHTEDLTDAEGAAGPGYLRVADIRDDGIRSPARALASASTEVRRLQSGDILVTLSGSVGRVARVPASLAGAVPSADIAVVRPGPDLRADYLAALLWLVPYQRWLVGHAQGATIQHLRLAEFRTLPVLALHEDDQRLLAAGLRPGDDAWRPIALLSETGENPFALAIATEPLLGLAEDDLLDDVAAHLATLRDRLWQIALDTSAVSFSRRLPSGGLFDAPEEEAVPTGHADDPFAEWIVRSQTAVSHAAAAIQELHGAERLVALDAALLRLRPPTRRMSLGLTWTDENGEASGPTFTAGLLFPETRRTAWDEAPTALQREAVARGQSMLRIVEHIRQLESDRLFNPEGGIHGWLDEKTVELGRPADLLLFVDNDLPFTVRNVVVQAHATDSADLDAGFRRALSAFGFDASGLREPDAPPGPPADETGVLDVFDAREIAPGVRAEGIVRLPAQTTSGARRLHVSVSYTHLDGTRRATLVVLDVTVQSIREEAFASPADLGPSPYVVGSPVSKQDLFFGRRGALERIYEQVGRPGQANIVLLEGNRRSGKSSVLSRVRQDAPTRLPGWIVADGSFQEGQGHAERAGLSTGEVFYRIARNAAIAIEKSGRPVALPGSPSDHRLFSTQVRYALKPFFDEAGDNAPDAFRELLAGWLDALGDTRLLLLLDEFDKIDEGIQNGVTSPQTPENLRALFQQEPRVSAVLAVFPRIARMRQSYWDALFGLGVKVALGPLEPDEALALVQEPVRGRLSYEGEAASHLVGLCGRQPFLVQTLADEVFKDRSSERRRTVTVDVVERAAGTMATNSEHFQGLWQVVRSDRQRLLLELVHRLSGGGVPVTRGVLEEALDAEGVQLPDDEDLGRDHLAALLELELVRRDGDDSGGDGRYVPASILMGRWIKQHIDPADLRALARAETT